MNLKVKTLFVLNLSLTSSSKPDFLGVSQVSEWHSLKSNALQFWMGWSWCLWRWKWKWKWRRWADGEGQADCSPIVLSNSTASLAPLLHLDALWHGRRLRFDGTVGTIWNLLLARLSTQHRRVEMGEGNHSELGTGIGESEKVANKPPGSGHLPFSSIVLFWSQQIRFDKFSTVPLGHCPCSEFPFPFQLVGPPHISMAFVW